MASTLDSIRPARPLRPRLRPENLLLASPSRAHQHEINLPPAAPRADQPLVPIADWGPGTITLRLLARIRLDPVAASSTPHDYPCTRRGCAAECSGRSGVGFHEALR